jgi:hypothetical protein
MENPLKYATQTPSMTRGLHTWAFSGVEIIALSSNLSFSLLSAAESVLKTHFLRVAVIIKSFSALLHGC